MPVQPTTYLNPVHPHPCPDPFVLKHAGEYWCYCTGFRPDGGVFGILHSTDLVHWREVGSALVPLPGGHTCYWAPEVTYDNGRFYLYYSVGNETNMIMRVAVAERPAGPFVDSGHALTTAEFAIDGHVFVDDDGQRYLFYATDFLTHSHIGTGVVVDRLLDPFHLASQPQPVTRARYDWQVYDPQRAEKGGVRWHTLEGPFVLKRKGTYYLMFSGGNWQNVSYGVGYATSPVVQPAGEWQQAADGQRVLPILRTQPEAGIVGPGHNSVVRGPDNQQLFCVYHRWSREADNRVLAIDRLDWVGDRLVVLGPTHTPQPAPTAPAVSGFAPGPNGSLGEAWQVEAGAWRVTGGGQAQAQGTALARVRLPGPACVLEVTLAALAPGAPAEAAYGVSLVGPQSQEVLRVALRPGHRTAGVAHGAAETVQALPARFDFAAEHLLRLEADGPRVCILLDNGVWRWEGRAAAPAEQLALFTDGTGAAFAGLAVTAGWQEDFDQPGSAPADRGWRPAGAAGEWVIVGGELRQTQAATGGSLLVKGAPLAAYELVVNGRCLEAGAGQPGGTWGLYPSYAGPDDTGPRFTIERHEAGWHLAWAPGEAFPLAADFDPYVFQQLRFRLAEGTLTVQRAGQPLGSLQVPARPGRVALFAAGLAAWEMVRVTAL
jgi:GH43 family beta-xylosidase